VAKLQQEIMDDGQRLDCIFDNEPLGFEKDPSFENKMIQAQDPLEQGVTFFGPIPESDTQIDVPP